MKVHPTAMRRDNPLADGACMPVTTRQGSDGCAGRGGRPGANPLRHEDCDLVAQLKAIEKLTVVVAAPAFGIRGEDGIKRVSSPSAQAMAGPRAMRCRS